MPQHRPPSKNHTASQLQKTPEPQAARSSEVFSVLEAQPFLNGGLRRAAALQGDSRPRVHNNMPVSDDALVHAGRIESLELLHIGGAVSDAGLKHLRSLHRLRDLQLGHCRRITDAGLESLAELPALETLDLSHTPITDTGLPHLARIKTLKHLNVTECKLSASAIDDLQDALPWCRLQR